MEFSTYLETGLIAAAELLIRNDDGERTAASHAPCQVGRFCILNIWQGGLLTITI